MPEEIVLDLGEYGEIVVESAEIWEEDGVRRVVRDGEERTRRKVDADALLREPLAGLSKLFRATLPQPRLGDPYELDEFTVQFGIAVEAEVGTDLGAVVKITPSGAMTCIYKWKRRKAPAAAAA
jgi:hypothetical protein